MICLSNKNNPVGVGTQIGLFILFTYLFYLPSSGGAAATAAAASKTSSAAEAAATTAPED